MVRCNGVIFSHINLEILLLTEAMWSEVTFLTKSKPDLVTEANVEREEHLSENQI